MKTIENICYTTAAHPRHKLDIHLPDAEHFPVFVYFHGGGLKNGDKAGHPFIPELTAQGIAVVSANYRMYPEAAYPDFIRDAAAAVSWVYKNMPQYGTVNGVFVGGSSAGGYLTQMLCFDKKYLAVYGIDADAVSGYIMDAGQPTVHFNVLKERGLDTRRVLIDEAAPIYHVSDGRTYAPMQIIVSDQDMENRYEQTVLLLSTLKHFGHDMSRIDYRLVENSKHCAYCRTSDAEGKNIFAKMVLPFIKANITEK